MKLIDDTGKSFDKIIKENLLYVDKTEYLYNIITSGKLYFFLSRPRRFGKSLTISTFESIFRGEKELFKNLYIGKTNYKFEKYPIFKISFVSSKVGSVKEFESYINNAIIDFAKEYDVKLNKEDDTSTNLKLALKEVSKKTDKGVVVLVDEYDAPITKLLNLCLEFERVGDMDKYRYYCSILIEVQQAMKDFYTTLKDVPEYLHFVYITGVTRFAKTGVFSGMNNPDDLSDNPNYNNAWGFTYSEILSNFSEYIDNGINSTKLERDEYLNKLKNQYDGYRFSLDGRKEETVYNPISICKFFSQGGEYFKDYWVQTGNTGLIINEARKNNFSIIKNIEEPVNLNRMNKFEALDMLDKLNDEELKFLMYQTGYLTLKNKNEDGTTSLKFSNNEVLCSFTDSVLSSFMKELGTQDSILQDTMNFFRNGDVDKAYKNIISLYAGLPYNYFTKDSTEDQVKSSLLFSLSGSFNSQGGESVKGEVSSYSDKTDIEVELKGHVYVIEVKVDESPEVALKCLKERGYYKKYQNSEERRVVHLLGINFILHSDVKGEKRLPEERYSEEILKQ